MVTLKKGWGYWDTTNYPYGGCFKRAAQDETVEIVARNVIRCEHRIKFADGRIGVVDARALECAA